MKKRLTACVLAAALAAPSYAADDQAVIRLVAYVPVQCTMDVLSGSIQGQQLVVDVRRTCNTSHEVSVVGRNDGSLGALKVAMNGSPMGVGDSTALYQPEAYYDRVDRITIEASTGDSEDLRAFAATLSINVNPS
jgi:hypothetical protein